MNHQEFKINGGTFNGPVVGINNGNIEQSLKVIKEIQPDLADLLNELKKEQLTQYHAEKVVNDLAELKTTEKKEKKSLIDKVVDSANKLLIVAESSAILYPIAQKVFEIIKNLDF